MSDEQVRASAAALQSIADRLAALGDRVNEIVNDLEIKLSRLGDTFRDDQFVEFKNAYLRDRRQLDEFVAELGAFVPVIRQDAEDLAASDRVHMRD